jgi:hypothetical protein
MCDSTWWLGENSAASIPEACQSSAFTKAAYRFFDHDRVQAKEIRKGFFKSTIDRIRQYPIIFGFSDATHIVYTSHKNLKGKGVLRKFKASGFFNIRSSSQLLMNNRLVSISKNLG